MEVNGTKLLLCYYCGQMYEKTKYLFNSNRFKGTVIQIGLLVPMKKYVTFSILKSSDMGNKILLAVSVLLFFATDTIAQQKVSIEKDDYRTDKPGFETAWKSIRRGDKLYSKGTYDYPLAGVEYSQALLYNAENSELNYKMGVCQLYSADKSQSLDYLLKAYTLKPDVAEDILFLIGRAYQYDGNFIEAVGKYTEYLDSDTKKDDILLARIRKYIDESNSGMLILEDTARILIKNLGDVINSTADDYSPVEASDGLKLYFASRRPTSKNPTDTYPDGMSDENVFLSTKSDDKWGFALPIEGRLNTGFCEAPLALSTDGNLLYVYAGYKGEGDILVSELKRGEWRDPVPELPSINSDYPETSIAISPSGEEIFIISARKKGLGGKDIYMAKKLRGKRWSKPENMTVLNSQWDEESVRFSTGGDTLWFSSRGHSSIGGFDIFYSIRMPEGSWSAPVNAGLPVNSVYDDLYFVQSKITDSLFYFVSNRSGGLGGMDIYSGRIQEEEAIMIDSSVVEEPPVIIIPEPVRITDTVVIIKEVLREVPKEEPVAVAKPEFTLGGRVLDATTNEPLVSRIDIIDPDTYQVVASVITVEADGSFSVNLKDKKSYMAEVRSNGYLSDMRRIEIPSGYVGNSFFGNLYLNKIEVGKKVVLNNIFFQTGKAVLTPSSFIELDKLIVMMNENPSMKIEISGHTDNTGSAAINDRLSSERARSVAIYLVSKGVPGSRVETKGFGSSQPIDSNTTEQGRSTNRRVEFKILEF
jgi:outer membrane protein OmpA-like peptidoglycan-associated protein